MLACPFTQWISVHLVIFVVKHEYTTRLNFVVCRSFRVFHIGFSIILCTKGYLGSITSTDGLDNLYRRGHANLITLYYLLFVCRMVYVKMLQIILRLRNFFLSQKSKACLFLKLLDWLLLNKIPWSASGSIKTKSGIYKFMMMLQWVTLLP